MDLINNNGILESKETKSNNSRNTPHLTEFININHYYKKQGGLIQEFFNVMLIFKNYTHKLYYYTLKYI